jgi:hypothetical protein
LATSAPKIWRPHRRPHLPLLHRQVAPPSPHTVWTMTSRWPGGTTLGDQQGRGDHVCLGCGLRRQNVRLRKREEIFY